MNKTQSVLEFMESNGSINHFQAIRFCKTTCLSQHVSVLRKQGKDIESVPVDRDPHEMGRPAVTYRLES